MKGNDFYISVIFLNQKLCFKKLYFTQHINSKASIQYLKMISNSLKSMKNNSKQKQSVFEIEETPEEQEQRELREFMATLDEEQEIGILQLPTFRHKTLSSSSSASKNLKGSKEQPKIIKPVTSPRSPRRHSKRPDSPTESKVFETAEEQQRRELKELLDHLEEEVEIGVLQAPSEFPRKVQPPTTAKTSNQRNENRSKPTSQIVQTEIKETPEEIEKREIRELIEQLADEQEIGILDPSTENRIAGRSKAEKNEEQIKDTDENKLDVSKSTEKAQLEILNDEDLEKLEIQKLFKELEDEQEIGVLTVPGGPRHGNSNSGEESNTETEVNVSVQETIVIEEKEKKEEEEDESLGLDDNSFESVDYATLKLPNEYDWEVEEEYKRKAERDRIKRENGETITQSQSARSHAVKDDETIESIFDTNASDIDAEPVWHVFRDPTYSFAKKDLESDSQHKGRRSQSDYSTISGSRKHDKMDDEAIAQELLLSENEKLDELSNLRDEIPPEFEENIASSLLLSEKNKELIDGTSTDKITFQTSEERVAHALLSSENQKDYSENENTARKLKLDENDKELVGSTSTDKMTFQTSEERIAKGLLSSENEKDDFAHVIAPEERIAQELLASENEKDNFAHVIAPEERIAQSLLESENEKVETQSISYATSTESLDKTAKSNEKNRNLTHQESNDTFTQETLVNDDEKDKLGSCSASSISNQDSCYNQNEDEEI